MKQWFKQLFWFIIITILLLQFASISYAQNIPMNINTESEQIELLSVTTIRNPGDDSGRWPGETGASTADNVDAFVSAALPTAWLLQTTSSVPVGVIDTGIMSNHEDITGSYMGGATFGGITTANSVDESGHGTKVTGIITGNGYNNKGSTGVCWSGNVKSLKAVSIDFDKQPTEKGYYYYELGDLRDAINYANSIGIKILNMSLGGIDTFNEGVLAAINSFNGLIVCSAGNDNKNTDTNPHYPSGYNSNKIIVVGALDKTLTERANYSNYGATSVDVFAPGTDIYTTVTDTVKYGEASGTSLAAPFVTGLAALMWELDPELEPEDIISKIKPT